MNSVQIGAADEPPADPKSRLSSNPTHTTHNKFEVYPANQPSFDVPVFPAAGALNPMARTDTPVPRLITSSITFVTRYATRGSSTFRVCGASCSCIVP